MKCELCGNEVRAFERYLPVRQEIRGDLPLETRIHLSCLKEILDVVRALTEESLSHRLGEDGSSDPEST